MINNGYNDELIMVRQNPGTNALTLAVIGDEQTNFLQKMDYTQRGGFTFGAWVQDAAGLRNPSPPTGDGALDVPALKRFLEDNHQQTFKFQIYDIWNTSEPDDEVTTPGREYVALVELLDLLKQSNSPIKITASIATPYSNDGKPFLAAHPGDSPLIGAAELGVGITDERTLFAGGPSNPDPEDYKGWALLLGILSNKYPNLVGVSMDDFAYDIGPGNTFTSRYMGKFIERLRAANPSDRFINWYSINDYFNKGTTGNAPSGWTVTTSSNTTCTIQNVPSSSDKSIRFTDNNASGAAVATKSFTSQTGTIHAEWRFMQSAFRGQKMMLRGGGTVAIEILGSTAGNLSYTDSGGSDVVLQAYSTNTWYTVKVIGNSVSDTCDIYVDGVLKAQGVGFKTAVSGIDNIYFATHTGSGDASYTQYIDSVSITK